MVSLFTGIVEETGRILSTLGTGQSLRLTIAAARVLEGTAVGDSIAVSGCCLTVTGLLPGAFTCDLMPETVQKTSLGRLTPGSRVNLERAARLGDRLGGHLVQGHVDGTGRILSIQEDEIARRVAIEAPPAVLRYTVAKGSIAVDGVSLTVTAVGPTWFEVSLIPHTLAVTSLGDAAPGDTVNLEADLIGKYVEKLLSGRMQ